MIFQSKNINGNVEKNSWKSHQKRRSYKISPEPLTLKGHESYQRKRDQ